MNVDLDENVKVDLFELIKSYYLKYNDDILPD